MFVSQRCVLEPVKTRAGGCQTRASAAKSPHGRLQEGPGVHLATSVSKPRVDPRRNDCASVHGGPYIVRTLNDYTKEITKLGRSRAWRDAVACFQQLLYSEMQPNVMTFGALANAYARGAQSSLAISLLEHMWDIGIAPNIVVYSATVAACDNASNWTAALHVLRDMRQHLVLPNVVTFSSAMRACSRYLHWARAVSLFVESRLGCLIPNAIMYNVAISSCERSALWEFASHLLFDMRQAWLSLDVITYSSAISTFEKGHMWTLALQLFEDMSHDQVHPNAFTYNGVMCAWKRGAHWGQALWLLQKMTSNNVSPDVATYNTAIGSCELLHHWSQALATFAMAANACISPTHITWNLLISTCLKGGAWEQVVALVDKMRTSNVRPERRVQIATIEAHTRYGPLHYSLEAYRDLVDDRTHFLGASRETTKSLHGQTTRFDANSSAMPLPAVQITSSGAELDLHECSVGIACLAVQAFLSSTDSQQIASIMNSGGLNIVTGRGQHSVHGVAVLKPAILKLLSTDLGLDVQENSYNPGCLFVPDCALLHFYNAGMRTKMETLQIMVPPTSRLSFGWAQLRFRLE